VGSRRKIDRRHMFALGWSSGGPAVYTAALEEKPVITGAFAAMSVFHPDELELSRAKGRPFFILHSPEDDVCPMRLAEEARDTLTAEGAAVEFLEYAGGHGWRGNVYGNISAGIHWLEEQTSK
jgi:predicted esterase